MPRLRQASMIVNTMALGAALPGFGFADEQPVLFVDGRWPEVVLDGVVVDLDATIFEIRGEHGPHRQRVVDGAAHGVARHVATP